MCRIAVTLAIAIGGVNPGPPARAAGSWIAQASTPDINQRGRRYTTRSLKPRSTTPLDGKAVTTVSWRYSFRPALDPRLRVALCAAGRCIDGSAGRGTSTRFAGIPVASPFCVYFLLPGSGMLARPLRGAPLQLVVNFK